MKSYLLVAVTAGAVAAAFSAVGAGTHDAAAAEQQQQNERIQTQFNELDRDDSGYIDAQEAQAYKGLKNAFPRIATDGQLEQADFAAWYREYDRPSAEE